MPSVKSAFFPSIEYSIYMYMYMHTRLSSGLSAVNLASYLATTCSYYVAIRVGRIKQFFTTVNPGGAFSFLASRHRSVMGSSLSMAPSSTPSTTVHSPFMSFSLLYSRRPPVAGSVSSHHKHTHKTAKQMRLCELDLVPTFHTDRGM